MNTLYLTLTTGCNLKCNFCFYTQEPRRLVKDKLNFKLLSSAIRQAPSLGFKEISFTGGEPLLLDDIGKLINLAKKLKLETTVSTNASLLNTKTIEGLKKAGLDNLYLSLASEYFFNKKENGKAWEEKAIKILARLKKAKIKKPTLVFVVTKENLKFLEAVLDFVEKERLSLQIQPAYIPLKKSKLSLFKLSQAERKQFRQLLERWGEKQDKSKRYLRLVLSYYSLTNKKDWPKFCHFAQEDLVIDADGSVYPCFHRQDLLLGKIANDNLKECLKRLKFKDKQEMSKAQCFGEHCLSLFVGQ